MLRDAAGGPRLLSPIEPALNLKFQISNFKIKPKSQILKIGI